MNVPVTSIYVSSMIIPNVVMIHRHWLKKITVELGKVTKKKGYAVKIGIFQGQFKLLVENNSMFSSPAFVFLYFSKTVFTVAILDRVKPEPSKEEIQITILGISDTDSMVMYLCVSFGSNCTAPATRLF